MIILSVVLLSLALLLRSNERIYARHRDSIPLEKAVNDA